MRILVVDDHPDAADALALVLGLSGFEARSLVNSSEVVSLVASFHPEVILTDINMPPPDGFTLAEQIRGWKDGAVKLIAMSAVPVDPAKAREAGFDAWLTKPVGVDEVNRVLESLDAAL